MQSHEAPTYRPDHRGGERRTSGASNRVHFSVRSADDPAIMPKHRLNLFDLPTARVSDALRAATPGVQAGRGSRSRTRRGPRIATIQTATPNDIRAMLSTGGTAHRDEAGDWYLTQGKKSPQSPRLGKRWRDICEQAYQTALRESANTED